MKLSKDQEHGKAYGVLTWRGKQMKEVSKIGSTGKHQWKLLATPDYKNFVPDPKPTPPKRRIKEQTETHANSVSSANVADI